MKQTTILIVEDNPIVAEDLKVKLMDLGYTVSATATNSKEAIDAVQETLPDIALMDINLGSGPSGIETAAILKKKFNLSVIYLTAHADDSTIQQAKETEPYGYIVKPFDDVELRSVIEVAIHKQKADNRLLESHQWLETILASIGDGVIATDAHGKVQFLNPEAERMTGWSDSDAIGVEIESVFSIISEKNLEPAINPVRVVLETEKPTPLADGTLLISRNGKEIPIKDSGAPIHDESGEIEGAVLIFQDDTKARSAKMELIRQKKTAERYLNLAAVMFIGLDAKGNVTITNEKAQQVLEAELDDIIGKNWFDTFIPERNRQEVKQVFEKVIAGEAAAYQYYENPVLTKNNTLRQIAWHNTIIDNENGEIIGLLSSGEDITERLQLQTKLHHAQKMEAIGTLAGGIAHDFNNLLSAILGFTELSLDLEHQDPALEENLLEIQSASLRARDIVGQILNFSRHSDDESEPILMPKVVGEIMSLIRSTLPTNIKIEERISSISEVLGVSSQIHQIFLNICSNAIHAMEKTGGVIKIAVEDISFTKSSMPPGLLLSEGPYVKIAIADKGDGIPEEDLKHVFEPYFTTKDFGKGTGMGLAVVHGIVLSYGGQIAVESEVGSGTTVTIYLPATKRKKSRKPDPQRQAGGGNERLLFIDDEPAICKYFEKLLTKYGYQTTVFHGGSEALKAIHEDPNQFDLIISDVTMPEMTGDQLAKRLLDINPKLKIILCTGYSSLVDVDSFEQIGVKSFLYKPIEKNTLLQKIREVLSENMD